MPSPQPWNLLSGWNWYLSSLNPLFILDSPWSWLADCWFMGHTLCGDSEPPAWGSELLLTMYFSDYGCSNCLFTIKVWPRTTKWFSSGPIAWEYTFFFLAPIVWSSPPFPIDPARMLFFFPCLLVFWHEELKLTRQQTKLKFNRTLTMSPGGSIPLWE